MTKAYERLEKCLAYVRSVTDFVPEAAVVLGSGLGAFADEIKVEAVIPYKDIPGFPVSTAPGHAGRFVFGYVGHTKVAAMQGRVHLYEGYTAEDVVLPARLMALMGAKAYFVTNASGGMRPDLDAGSLMLMTDHISVFVPNPLIGPNIDELGTRFPDMSCPYDKALRAMAHAAAEKNGIDLREGIYAQLTGPCFESPAEIRMLMAMGADAVGMSTVVEVIAARHAGLRVCGISCVANLAAGLSPNPLSGEEVLEIADRTGPKFRKLLWDLISGAHDELIKE